MRHHINLGIGPTIFRIGSDWRAPIEALTSLYQSYPLPVSRIPDYSVRLEAERPWRRFIRPSVAIRGDYSLPEAVPMALSHGLLAAEMAMNLQLALGERRFLLLHAACVEKKGRALILTGESGSGKSTLSALLGESGWRFMGDEFTLIDTMTGAAHPFPRPVSLKNQAIAVMEARVSAKRLGPILSNTPKGTLRHLIPPPDALARMTETAQPALILFPRFGHASDIRPIGASEVFVRLTQASTNYVALGEAGYGALTRLVTGIPARAVDYPDTKSALQLVDELWAAI
jgi:HprK-related kinase A